MTRNVFAGKAVIAEPAWDGRWGRGYGDLEDERSGVGDGRFIYE